MSTAMPALQRKAHAFVQDLLTRIQQEPSFEQALVLGTWLARYLVDNSCGIYRLDELETTLLAKVGPVPVPTPVQRRGELHVASAIYRTGGHTPLMKTLISEAQQGTDSPDALLTWPIDPREASDILELPARRILLLDHGQDKIGQLAQLCRFIAAYDKVVLHIHPDDILSALAARIVKQAHPELRLAFMNHADHTFSVGIGAVDKVFEISGYGWQLHKARGIEDRATFVGIPIRAPSQKPPAQPTVRYAFSGGAAYKYRPFGAHSLPPVLLRLLRLEPRLSIWVIGPKSKDRWWWPLRLVGGKRVRLLKSLAKPAYLDMLHNCAIYIDSHPWPGGTAFPEALMRGLHVAGLRGGMTGYSCADSLLSDSPKGFLDECQSLLRNEPAVLERQAQVRQLCVTFHAPAQTRARMESGFTPGSQIPLPQAMHVAQTRPAFEENWLCQGGSVTPSVKDMLLDLSAQRIIVQTHRRHFGFFDHASLKLWFDFRIRKKTMPS